MWWENVYVFLRTIWFDLTGLLTRHLWPPLLFSSRSGFLCGWWLFHVVCPSYLPVLLPGSWFAHLQSSDSQDSWSSALSVATCCIGRFTHHALKLLLHFYVWDCVICLYRVYCFCSIFLSEIFFRHTVYTSFWALNVWSVRFGSETCIRKTEGAEQG